MRPEPGSVRARDWAPTMSPVPVLGAILVGETNLQLTMPLVWALVILSAIGAVATFGALIWTLWKYRDPATRGRRYG